jgi:methylenetetrahydrofolate reductase (NADPH)
LLRGDSKSVDTRNQDPSLFNEHATDLQEQVNNFNKGIALDGSRIDGIETPFSYGMACYPEKHEEAPNMESDIYYLKKKVENGAQYVVTQMFFDNQKYFDFVDRCRAEGITIPIIPGIKPIVLQSQLTVLPKIFRTDLPEPLAAELRKCKTDAEVREVGVEWSIAQSKELMAHGVPGLHFYTLMASDSVYRVAKEIF